MTAGHACQPTARRRVLCDRRFGRFPAAGVVACVYRTAVAREVIGSVADGCDDGVHRNRINDNADELVDAPLS